MEPKEWLCVGCGAVLGHVAYGQLVFHGVNGNTDDSNFVIVCPECGRPKTWFSYDKLDKIIDSIASRVVTRMQSSNR